MTGAPKVLHLTTTAISLDWLLAPQLVAFAEAGFEVLTASAPGPHVDAIRSRGIAHFPLPSLSRNMDLRRDWAACRELRALIATHRPDIVHTHNPKPGVLGRIAARHMHVPIVVNTVHGLYAQPTDPLRRRLPVFGIERAAAMFSDAELVQNPEDVALLRSLGVPSERVHLLGNGIDLARFSPNAGRSRMARAIRHKLGIAPSTPVVGMVGRLVWEKGYREFFGAIRALRAEGDQDFAVVVVGPDEVGKAGAVDQAAIDDMRAHGVHFLGSRNDVEVILAALDVFVLPSHREGFPRAAMEASAMGVPVVASDIRGCRQVVAHGETGFLVPARNELVLAGALSRLLHDRPLRQKLGAAARARALREFDQARVIARTLAVYRSQLELLGRERPQPARSTQSRYSDSIDLVADAASKRDEFPAAA